MALTTHTLNIQSSALDYRATGVEEKEQEEREEEKGERGKEGKRRIWVM